MPKNFFLLAITLVFFSCRKDDTSNLPETNDFWDYSGTYLSEVSGSSGDAGGSSAHNSSSDSDRLFEVTQQNDSIFFLGRGYPITLEGQLTFSHQAYNNSSQLTFSSDLNSLTYSYNYPMDGAGNWSNSSLTGALSTYSAPGNMDPHPRKNEIDGNYVFTYSETDVDFGTVLIDTSYSDTAYLSIHPYSDYSNLIIIGTDSVLVDKFFSYYDYSFSSWYSNNGKTYNISNGQLQLSGSSNGGSSNPSSSSSWSYSGYKL